MGSVNKGQISSPLNIQPNEEVISKLLRRREYRVIYERDASKFKNQGTSTKNLSKLNNMNGGTAESERTGVNETDIIEKQHNNI